MPDTWKEKLDDKVVERCSQEAGSQRIIRVLIDTRERKVLALLPTESKEESHAHQAAVAVSHLTGRKTSEKELNTFNAGYLVGGMITFEPASGEFHGTLMPTTLNTLCDIRYTKKTLSSAEEILQRYLDHSKLVRESSVRDSLKAS